MRPAIRFLSAAMLLALMMPQIRGQSTELPMAPAQTPSSSNPRPATPAPAAEPNTPLTRADAERMALANNPRVSISRLLTLTQHQVVRESRSGELPQLEGSLTA